MDGESMASYARLYWKIRGVRRDATLWGSIGLSWGSVVGPAGKSTALMEKHLPWRNEGYTPSFNSLTRSVRCFDCLTYRFRIFCWR